MILTQGRPQDRTKYKSTYKFVQEGSKVRWVIWETAIFVAIKNNSLRGYCTSSGGLIQTVLSDLSL